MPTKFIEAVTRIGCVIAALGIVCVTSSCTRFSQAPTSSSQNVLQNCRLLVLVTTKNWDAVPGRLQRFERDNPNQPWREVGSPIEIVVGRSGLGWGRGLHPTNFVGPAKIEGDGKSPAGIFKLSSAFGFASVSEMKSLKLPYVQMTDSLECVDDVQSPLYNSIVDRAKIPNADWKSSEKMLAIGEAYRLGVVVDHNISSRIAGKGSCIFIHIWKGDGSGTSGCTAMEKSEMEKFIHWLDVSAQPVLVQLPETEFKKVQSEWHLPKLKTISGGK